jgi:YgiT-type zinc finger domain-containing protein
VEDEKGEKIVTCFLCKGCMAEDSVTHTADLNGMILIIKNVPALVCKQCGEVWYDGAVAQQLDRIAENVSNAAITEIAVVNYVDLAA